MTQDERENLSRFVSKTVNFVSKYLPQRTLGLDGFTGKFFQTPQEEAWPRVQCAFRKQRKANFQLVFMRGAYWIARPNACGGVKKMTHWDL